MVSTTVWLVDSSFAPTFRYFRTQSVTYALYAPSLRAKTAQFEAKSKHVE